MKTRFAPSPTGYIHIGNVRSAIYPYLLAQQNHGEFILRIEDTDRARYVDGATELIEDTLKWLGLDWDEGPEIGGPNAPYFQTERKDIYLEWAKKLIASGRAYADNTPSEEITAHREQYKIDKLPFLYRDFRPENPPEWHEGMPIRFKAEPKAYDYHDEVFGDLHMGPETQDDIILIKADGLPTYNFAHIVDDAVMGVTHIFRGQEYLPSMGNYLALYEALNIEPPVFVHLPHILAPTGNKKLGKRDGAKSVTEYRADGVLPEAMLNYLANLGWNDGTEQEIYTKSELIKKFSLDKIQKAGARYDETKLLWMNGQWLRKIATGQIDVDGNKTDVDAIATPEGIDKLYTRTTDFWPTAAKTYNVNYQKHVLTIIYDRLKTLGDLKTMTAYFFEDPTVDPKMITENKFLKKFSEQELSKLLQTTAKALREVNDWQAETLQNTLNDLLATTEKKPAELFSLIRLSLSFAPFSPALHLTLEVLGRDVALSRIQKTITALEND